MNSPVPEPNDKPPLGSHNRGSIIVFVEGSKDKTWRPRRFYYPKTWDEVRRLYGIPKPPPPPEEPEKPASSDEPK